MLTTFCVPPPPPPTLLPSYPPLQDRCVGTTGSTYKAPNGALANMKLGSRHFLLEQNWANTSPGKCMKAYP